MRVACDKNNKLDTNVRFVKIEDLNAPDICLVAKLLLEAESAGKVSYGNVNPNLIPVAADAINMIQPYSKYTNVLVKDKSVMGFFVVTSKKQITDIRDNVIDSFKDDPEFMSCLHFYDSESYDNDLILHDIAIDSKYRARGLFKLLVKYLFEMAFISGCKRILFVVRESNPALAIYKYYGAKILGKLNTKYSYPNEKFLKCCFTVSV